MKETSKDGRVEEHGVIKSRQTGSENEGMVKQVERPSKVKTENCPPALEA